MIPKAPSHSQLRMLPKVPALEFANPGPMLLSRIEALQLSESECATLAAGEHGALPKAVREIVKMGGRE